MPRVADWDEGWRRLGRGTAKEVEAWEGEGKEETVKLAARHEHRVTFELMKEQAEGVEERLTVWWSCSLDAKDVDVSLTCRAASLTDAPSYVLLAPTRHHASGGVIRGCHSFTLVESGTDAAVATLTLSNHMSTFSGKEVRLRTGMRRETVKSAA